MGGKSSPPPPDYEPMARASEEAARVSEQLGNRQIDLAERQYEEMKPLAEKVANSQIEAQEQGMQQGQEYYDYLKNTYRPLERQIVSDAQEFNTDSYRDELARKAAADSALAFQQTQRANERNLNSMGVNPNSGRYAATQQAAATQNAAARAGLMSQTRQQARDTGYARQLDAAGLGRNLSGASQGAYSLANSSGSSALNSAAMPGQGLQSGLAQGSGTIMQGQAQKMQGLGSIMNTQANVYNTGQEREAAAIAGIGQAAGMVGGFAAGGYFPGG